MGPSISVFSQSANDSSRFRIGESLEPELEPEKNLPDVPFEFDLKKWNTMRRSIEGESAIEKKAQSVQTSSKTVTSEPPKPAPGLINVELPYESSLSVTGRKVIKLDITNTQITKERASELGGKQNAQTFSMEQELQARIQGTVARKTTINVNFDDTKENVRDFSVVYKGDPDEVVQEAAFGDIVLSLPSTQFVNYNKQLFGLRTALKYKQFGLMAIGSRTKGTTETKRFTGATTRQQVFVNDTAYIRRKFYDLTFSTSPAMLSGPLSGKTILPINDAAVEVIYIEDTTGLLPFPQAQNYDIATPTAPATTINIRMRQLSRGVDYSIDRIRGIVTFTNTIPEDSRVAIDFTLASGERLSSLVAGGVGVLIKDKNPETAGVSQEIKRFYFVGARNINRDNGLGNFIFKVLDKNRDTEIGNTLVPIQRYPDTIEMKFETGIFELERELSFSDLYLSNINTGSPLFAVFSVEYQAILRTYTLRPNIVLQSESVSVNGRKLARDLDYFIDYDIGLITFFNEDLIRESTEIEVTYEFAPFGGVLGETLVGARGMWDVASRSRLPGVGLTKWSAGSTVLYNFATKPTSPPDVRSSAASLLVTEVDSTIEGFKIGKIPFVSKLSIEAARSSQDPNLFGRALIDSMEGVKQEDSSPLLRDSWLVASNPLFGTHNLVTDFRGRDIALSHLRWDEGDTLTSDTNDGGTTQKALTIGYSLNTQNGTTPEQVSMVNIISLSGRDFSKKSTLEVEVEGAGTEGAGVDLIFDYGSFNEDADSDGVLDTEDRIPFDGTLNLGEDNGWLFNGPGNDLSITSSADNTSIGIGAGNARLDAEDLNGDRVLGTTDFPATFSPLFKLSNGLQDSQGNTVSDLSFTGRKLFQIPINLNSLSAEEKARLTAVRQVRLTIRNNNGAAVSKSGSIVLVRLSMVGNSYEPATLSDTVLSTMTVRGINTKDDAGVYSTIIGNGDYADLYKDSVPKSDAKEQALALVYTLQPGSTGTTRNLYSAARDFSKHEEFVFFLSKKDSCVTGCGKFIFQVGSETEFQQATVDLDNSNIPAAPIWTAIKIKQSDLNNDGTPDTWQTITPGVTITRVGSVPNLSQISQIKMGVRNDSGAVITNQVWVNEIHLKNPKEKLGHAKRATFNTVWENWMDLGGSYQDVDRNWQTPTTAITNQDNTRSDAYANFNRLAFLPMSFKTTRDRTLTPSAFRANQNALVSFLEEGRVERIANVSSAKLIIPKLPVLDFNYSNDETENTLSQRKELNDTLSIGASYAFPKMLDVLPGNFLTFRILPTNMTFTHINKTSKVRFPDVNKLVEFSISTTPFNSTNLTQTSSENEARMNFRPWEGFSFNPTYRLRVEKEKRDFRDDEILSIAALSNLDNRETPRSIVQNISASGNLKLLKWLDPRYNYSFSGTETNGLPTLTNTTAYSLKTITRNSQGEISGNIQASQVFTRSLLLRSMNLNSSYKVENGDSYQDVPEGFKWRSQYWVGNPLAISSGTEGRRVELTDRRTFRTGMSWQPFGAYQITNTKMKLFNTMSLTGNYQASTEDSETTGSAKRVTSLTWPDLILTINDIEDLFSIKRVLDNSRLVVKTNKRVTETRAVTKSRSNNLGSDYQFQFLKKWDVSTGFNLATSRDDNLVSNLLASKSNTLSYFLQTRIPWKIWAFTPRFERSKTDTKDSIRTTNDLLSEVYQVQIYGDINRPVGLRIGRRELALANRVIINSTVKWDKKRSSVNPGSNYLDTYSGTLSADYTISQNFRIAFGGNFSQEVHHPDFKKLDRLIFGLNSVLTIQF
ncbi:MAG: hypothetical protein ACKVQC_10075 [Elusimicrobiota bacterium]